jgi:hypothetical protein
VPVAVELGSVWHQYGTEVRLLADHLGRQSRLVSPEMEGASGKKHARVVMPALREDS